MTGKDPMIDRSNAQKELRVQEMREELRLLGYSVVPTKSISDEVHQFKDTGTGFIKIITTKA